MACVVSPGGGFRRSACGPPIAGVHLRLPRRVRSWRRAWRLACQSTAGGWAACVVSWWLVSMLGVRGAPRPACTRDCRGGVRNWRRGLRVLPTGPRWVDGWLVSCLPVAVPTRRPAGRSVVGVYLRLLRAGAELEACVALASRHASPRRADGRLGSCRPGGRFRRSACGALHARMPARCVAGRAAAYTRGSRGGHRAGDARGASCLACCRTAGRWPAYTAFPEGRSGVSACGALPACVPAGRWGAAVAQRGSRGGLRHVPRAVCSSPAPARGSADPRPPMPRLPRRAPHRWRAQCATSRKPARGLAGECGCGYAAGPEGGSGRRLRSAPQPHASSGRGRPRRDSPGRFRRVGVRERSTSACKPAVAYIANSRAGC
jgi:hypothetical protein